MYIYLSSNVKNQQTDELNTCSSFTTKLPSTLRFEGQYEVGLVEISLTKSWSTIESSHIYYTHTLNRDMSNRNDLIQFPSISKIPKGHYDVKSLCKLIDGLIAASAVKNFPTWVKLPKIKFVGLIGKMVLLTGLTADSKPIFLRFSPHLEKVLGYEKVLNWVEMDSSYSSESGTIKRRKEEISTDLGVPVSLLYTMDDNEIDNLSSARPSDITREFTEVSVPSTSSDLAPAPEPPVSSLPSAAPALAPASELSTTIEQPAAPAQKFTPEQINPNAFISIDEPSGPVSANVPVITPYTISLPESTEDYSQFETPPSPARILEIQQELDSVIQSIKTFSDERLKDKLRLNRIYMREVFPLGYAGKKMYLDYLIKNNRFDKDYTVTLMDKFYSKITSEILSEQLRRLKSSQNTENVSIPSLSQVIEEPVLKPFTRQFDRTKTKEEINEDLSIIGYNGLYTNSEKEYLSKYYETFNDNQLDETEKFIKEKMLISPEAKETYLVHRKNEGKLHNKATVRDLEIALGTELDLIEKVKLKKLGDTVSNDTVGKSWEEKLDHFSNLFTHEVIPRSITIFDYIAIKKIHYNAALSGSYTPEDENKLYIFMSKYSFNGLNARNYFINQYFTNPDKSVYLRKNIEEGFLPSNATAEDLELMYVTLRNIIEKISTEREKTRSKRSVAPVSYSCIAQYETDLNGGIYDFMVYSDLVENTIVGDTFAPILAVVNSPHSNVMFGDQYNVKFDRPQYKRLKMSELNSIYINIRSDYGEDVPFQFGRTICVLHIKKIDNV